MAEPIIVEPLELEYLKTVCDSLGLNSYILDELFSNNYVIPSAPTVIPSTVEGSPGHVIPNVVEGSPGYVIPTNVALKALRNLFLRSTIKLEGSPLYPHIIVLTGYNVAEDQILLEAKQLKSKFPNVKIIVGGIHIQLNSSAFHIDEIDFVIHSSSLDTFEKVLKVIIEGKEIQNNIGFDYRKGATWVIGDKEVVIDAVEFKPNRELFNHISHKTHYLEKRRVALIKGSTGCPYSCSYCYCKELNGGRYLRANYENIVKEMANINADYFWIVDDVLFVNKEDVFHFIDAINKEELKTKIIAYLRADFIIKEQELLPSLKEAGLNEIIIGFEAINEEELKNYNKTTNAIDYPEVIRILKKNNIDFTALFMVNPNYGVEDFINLSKFIGRHKIEIFTLSIFTPIKGTKGYEEQKDKLLTQDPKYFDFLHLVTPSKLPKIIFYILFYMVHLRLIFSKRIWKYLLRRKA